MTFNLTNLLASQVTSYILHDDSYSNESLKKINYVTAANGLFRVEKTVTGIFKAQLSKTAVSIPGLKPMEEGVELLIPRIPFKYLLMALAFYRDVHARDKTEASLLFFWNKDNKPLPATYSDGTKITGLLVDGQLVVYVPKQVNSSTLSEFHMDTAVTWFRENLSLLAETHSHHTMKAFFSATDNANENATQFYGVWGEINNQEPAFAFRYCSGDTKKEISPDSLFEWPIVTKTTIVETTVDGMEPFVVQEQEKSLYAGPFPRPAEYPSDWMDKIKRKPITTGFNHRSNYNPSFANQLEFEQMDFAELHSQLHYDGMEHAKALHYFGDEDARNFEDIGNNIADLTAEYKALGFDNEIETAIKGKYHTIH